ncbi:MAG TPA: leucine--tRNA ligase [Candidatus Nanoarchaeia archaeon]|nr:leucine--tRNA ligase [Candidatus Nanoarchaeia archaeon]
MDKFNHLEIEKKWHKIWGEENLYRTGEDKSKPKYYVLDMFPYPSGAGLHVGHPKGYIATDILARMKMMQGYNVLHPMGWDAFGLPAENFALKNKVHPRVATEKNIATFKNQLEKIGLTYDWEREINTTDPEYYKWTQWAFIKMWEKGLAYESTEPIIWCPTCQTGLAMEDLENGKCERCESEVVRKPMRQWVIKITAYAERLLADLDKLPGWEDSIKEMQRNWIGKSEGAEIRFKIRDKKEVITVFTTRPDTLFGCTYVVLAPENPLIGNWKLEIGNWSEVEKYINEAKKKTDLQRTDLNKDKSGVRLEGIMAINPANNEEVPVFIADYVLPNYGTGAIMAVPAHDERDFEFAKKYNEKLQITNDKLKIKSVIDPVELENLAQYKIKDNEGREKLISELVVSYYPEKENIKDGIKQLLNKVKNGEIVHIGDGILINSDFLNGLSTAEAKKKMIEWLEKEGKGKRKINYKLNDWVFSRQRYWGEPIPMVHCPVCGTVPVAEKDLPVRLPEVEHYEPSGTGESPLANISDWVNTTCPVCGGPAKRETNTMPQWAGSSWYYLRYIDPKNSHALVDKDKEKYWSPVDFYVGGAEHATRHLIYARFWHKFLFDIGAVNYEEPFAKFTHVGLIMAEDGRKMSKRWGNVINPDDIIEKFGADAMRVYEMFMGPFTQSCAWNTNGLVGARKFLDRIWTISGNMNQVTGSSNKEILSLLHKTIKKVSEDIADFKFNTCVSAMMILSNAIEERGISQDDFAKFIQILAPFAPHLAEEIWREKLGNKKSIFSSNPPRPRGAVTPPEEGTNISGWPKFDPELIKDETINLIVQVNGKLRATISVPADISEADAKKLAQENENVKKWLEGKEIAKIIFVPGKLLNIVAE